MCIASLFTNCFQAAERGQTALGRACALNRQLGVALAERTLLPSHVWGAEEALSQIVNCEACALSSAGPEGRAGRSCQAGGQNSAEGRVLPCQLAW